MSNLQKWARDFEKKEEVAALAVTGALEASLDPGMPKLDFNAGFLQGVNHEAKVERYRRLSKSEREITDNYTHITKQRIEVLTAATLAKERLHAERERLESERENRRHKQRLQEIAEEKAEEELKELRLKNRQREGEIARVEAMNRFVARKSGNEDSDK